MKKKRFRIVQTTKVVTIYVLQCRCGMTIDIEPEIITDILNEKLGGYGGIICPKCNSEYCITKEDLIGL